MYDCIFTDPPFADETHDGALTTKGDDDEAKLIDFDSLTTEELREHMGLLSRVCRRWFVATMEWRHIAGLEEEPPKGWRFVRMGVWCLSGGTVLYGRTPNGPREISVKDLVRQKNPLGIELWNGERWTKITGFAQSEGKEDRQITLRSGERINCTVDHQWPTNRGLLRAEELRVGDVIETTRLPEPEMPEYPSGLPDDDIGWLVGMFVAEGTREKAGVIHFAGHQKEDARYERLSHIARMYGGSANLYHHAGNGATITIQSRIVASIIDTYVSGDDAKSKYLSSACWRRSNEFLDAVLDGYLEGDGHWEKGNNRWRLGFTDNRYLESSLRTICARLGYEVRIHPRWVRAFGKDYPIFKGQLRKTRSGHFNSRENGEIIALSKGTGRVYWDIGVEDDPHLFALASGVLTHNCKPTYKPQISGDRPATGWEAIGIFHRSERDRPKRMRWNGGGKSAVYIGNKENGALWPTQKPLWLPRAFIRDFAEKGGRVLDPYGGSGTFGVAGLLQKMEVDVCEINPEGWSLIARRLAECQPEGTEAVLLKQGSLFG